MKIITTHKRAHFDYEIVETMEAGIVLSGDEVKSIRNKQVSINDAFATVNNNTVVLLNCYIAPYSHAYTKKDISRQTRTLLFKKKEINYLIGAISKKGLTLIPLKLYFNDRGYVKLQIGIARHKNAVNKKQALKERDLKRESNREIKARIR